MSHPFDPSRRRTVGFALAGAAAATWSTLSFAGPAGARAGNKMVLVILRGGMDGLGAAPAIGDPAFASARGPLGTFPTPALKLDDTFALNPALAGLHASYGRGELTVVHAVGLPYRDRSHFDAQQVLESGGTRPYELATGWLGRSLANSAGKGMALSTAVPLVLRGKAEVDTWAPSTMADPSADLVARLEKMYAGDPTLANALQRAKTLHFDGGLGADPMPGNTPMTGDAGTNGNGTGNGNGRNGNFGALAKRAAEFLCQPDGPQVAVLDVFGWDSHANQAAAQGPFTNALRQLDNGLTAMRDGLVAGKTWDRTMIVVASEFGREVAINGTGGTDHGTGGVAFVLGGKVNGGRVMADWPGLAKKDRYEGRDLRTTTDTRALLKGVLGEHLDVASGALDREVFPNSTAVKPLSFTKT